MIAESLFINSRRIKEGLVILFDLDGTLLDTNLANNEAYNYGLWKVTGRSDYPQLKHLQRITRNDVASLEGIDEENLNISLPYEKGQIPLKESFYNTICAKEFRAIKTEYFEKIKKEEENAKNQIPNIRNPYTQKI